MEEAPPPAQAASAPWQQRKLLFFAGHIPKLYIRPTRYQIWRQLRRVPNVTLLSSTLYCGYGPFDTCAAVCRPSTAPRRCGSRSSSSARSASFCASQRPANAASFSRSAGRRSGGAPVETADYLEVDETDAALAFNLARLNGDAPARRAPAADGTASNASAAAAGNGRTRLPAANLRSRRSPTSFYLRNNYTTSGSTRKSANYSGKTKEKTTS